MSQEQREAAEAAMIEAYASAPQDILVLDTLEVYHRTLETPIRIVRYPVTGPTPDTFKLLLEEDAPVDAGQIVDFLGCPFKLKYPDQTTDSIGTFEIRIDGINDQLDEYMENAAMDGGAITGTYRTYVHGMEFAGPSSVWRDLELQDPKVQGMTFIIEAAVLKWAIRPYGRIYTAMEYPGLVVGR